MGNWSRLGQASGQGFAWGVSVCYQMQYYPLLCRCQKGMILHHKGLGKSQMRWRVLKTPCMSAREALDTPERASPSMKLAGILDGSVKCTQLLHVPHCRVHHAKVEERWCYHYIFQAEVAWLPSDASQMASPAYTTPCSPLSIRAFEGVSI